MKARFESIIPLKWNSFNAFLEEKPEFDAPWHYHPEYELTLIISSKGVRYVGNNIQNFDDGDLVLLGSNLPHCWKNTGVQLHQPQAVVIQWKEDLLGRGWLDTPEFVTIKQLLQLSHRGMKFEKQVSDNLKDKLLGLLDLPPFQKMLYLFEILFELSQTKDYQVLCDQDFSQNLNYDESERINNVYQYVKMHYSKKIKLADVAGITNMSEASFSRFFSKVMKKTFFSFLNEYRINVACKLLIETDRTAAQISYDSGYETLPFFYKQFKKTTGYAPVNYRMRYQKI